MMYIDNNKMIGGGADWDSKFQDSNNGTWNIKKSVIWLLFNCSGELSGNKKTVPTGVVDTREQDFNSKKFDGME